MKRFFLLWFFLLPILEIKAQAVQWAMMQNICPPTMMGGAESPRITSDGVDLLSFGSISNSITFGSQTMTGNNGKNSYLAKHDNSGNLIWAKHIQGFIRNSDITTDLNKNVFITGQYWDSLYIGNLIFTNPSIIGKAFMAKFDPAGNFLWARTTSPGSFAIVNSITTDGLGNVYSAGIFRDSMSIGATTLIPLGQDDIFLVKYDTNGNLKWLKGFGTIGMDVDPIVTGGLTSDVYVSSISRKFTTASPGGYHLKKFNNAGQEQWSKFISHGFADGPASLTTDALENVYMAGRLDTTLAFGSKVLTYLPGTPNNTFLAKISPGGNWKWARKIQTGKITSYDFSMAGEKRNELNIKYSDFSGPNINFYLSKLDTAGTILKTSSFLNKPMIHLTNTFFISDFTTDNAGNTYFSGSIAGSNTFGTINLIAPPSIPGPALPSPSAGYIAKILDGANSVSGTLFIDVNGNGLKDTGEQPFENGMIEITPGPGYASSAANGAYTAFLLAGTYNLQLLQTVKHYTFSPQNHSVTFAGLGQHQTKDFALVPIPNRNDVKISVTNITRARPGFNTKYRITFENVGTTTLSDSITFTYPGNHLTYTTASVAPASQQAGKGRWFYQALQPTEKRNIDVEFTVAASAPLNTLLNMVAYIKPFSTDYFSKDNADTLVHTVTGSYDPNDKQVNHATLTPTQVANGKPLDYVIRFQNTGNDTAFTVVVHDSISNKLNMASFELLSASHPYTFRLLENGMAEWRFDNILLPDSSRNEPASHGFIRYRMKPKNSLVLGDEIKSRAAIYFDYNAPVHTNYAVTRISNPLGIKETKAGLQAFNLYPNPASNYVTVEADLKKQTAATITLVNMVGQTVKKVSLPASSKVNYQLPVTELPKGVYIVQLKTENDLQVKRLVIQ
jgi:uncharacterized repeat protein (TIGR01451 family)